MKLLSLPVSILRVSLMSMVVLWLGLLWLMSPESWRQLPFGTSLERAG
jgi:hypothetical protein